METKKTADRHNMRTCPICFCNSEGIMGEYQIVIETLDGRGEHNKKRIFYVCDNCHDLMFNNFEFTILNFVIPALQTGLVQHYKEPAQKMNALPEDLKRRPQRYA